jgi:hypothetical protein
MVGAPAQLRRWMIQAFVPVLDAFDIAKSGADLRCAGRAVCGSAAAALVPKTIYRGSTARRLGGLHRGNAQRTPHSAAAAPAASTTGHAPTVQARGHDDDRSASHGGRRSLCAGALERRLDHRGGQPLGDRQLVRCSRFTVLVQLPERHTAEAVRDAIIAALAQLPT